MNEQTGEGKAKEVSKETIAKMVEYAASVDAVNDRHFKLLQEVYAQYTMELLNYKNAMQQLQDLLLAILVNARSARFSDAMIHQHEACREPSTNNELQRLRARLILQKLTKKGLARMTAEDFF